MEQEKCALRVPDVPLEGWRLRTQSGASWTFPQGTVLSSANPVQRVYSGAVQPHVGVGIIRQGAGTQFCTDVVRHFRAVVMPYPVGHEVVLPDGRRGVVSAVDPLDPDRPTVRVPQGRTIEVTISRRARSPSNAVRGALFSLA